MASKEKRQAAANAGAQRSVRLIAGSPQRTHGAQLPEAIRHDTRLNLQCKLLMHEPQVRWIWKQKHEHHGDQQSLDGVQTTVRVSQPAIFTSRSLLLLSGATQYTRYEDVRLRSKKRSRAHPSHQQFKPLSSNDSKFYRRAQSKQQQQECADRLILCQIPTSGFTKHRVRQVSCGTSHCVALVSVDDFDSLYAWGTGVYGQLGLGEQQVASTMARIDTLSRLQAQLETTDVALRCGPFATYVLVKNTSIVWHWGLLPSSAPITTNKRFVLQGVPVEFPMVDSSLDLIDIGVGVEHVVLLSASGQVFTWGFGANGQLGLGHERNRVVDRIVQPVNFFFPSHEQLMIVAIVSGWHHNLALASDQTVFAWGSNHLGACGATTKFHEYFSPVRVPIQHLRASISDGDDQYAISCCGNTSVLTTRSRNSGLLTSAFVWGVCSESVAVLTPVEVSEVPHQGCFQECEAGFGVLHLVHLSKSMPSEQDSSVQNCRLLQIQTANGSSAAGSKATIGSSRAVASSELLAFDLALGEVRSLRMIDLESDEESVSAWHSVDRLTIREVQISESYSNRQLVELVTPPKSVQTGALEVQLRAIALGSAKVELVYDGVLIFGSPIEVRVEQKRAQERSLATVAAAGMTQTEPIKVCAVSVVNKDQRRSSQQLVLADLTWESVSTRRVRIRDDDTLVLLVEGMLAPIEKFMLRLEDQFGDEIQAEITLRGFVEATKSSLAAIAVRCPRLGVLSLVVASPGSGASSIRRRLVEVTCIMNAAARGTMLTASGSFIEKAFTASTSKQGDKVFTRAAFSAFVSTLLSNAQLRDAIANTPFAATADVESERDWDIDYEIANRRALCAHPNDPFVLWRTENLMQPFNSERGSPNVDVDHQEGQMRFWDVLPKWTLENPAVVELSLTPAFGISVLKESCEASTPCDGYDEDTLEGAQVQALNIGLSVSQSPHEFLVHGNLVSDCNSSSLPFPIEHVIEEVVTAWRDQHGELFFASQPATSSPSLQQPRAEYAIQVYGHESHHFRETAMRSRVSQWKTKLHQFLWELLDEQQCSFEDLFQRFLFESDRTTRGDKGGHMQLRGFVSTLEGLGFSSDDGTSSAPSKQEWLTLFTEIQRLAAEATATPERVTRSVFKTFLIDPFHQLFWRHYVDTLQSLALKDVIVQTLLAHFRPPPGDNLRHFEDEHEGVALWSDFVASLSQFHEELTRSSSDKREPGVLVSASDCCRILYRFDIHCSGWISTRLFQQCVIASLRDSSKSSTTSSVSTSALAKKVKQRTAVRNARRPDVDTFSTPNAVQKLFLARAYLHQKRKPPSPDSRSETVNHGESIRKSLMHAGNTHLARIRSLPVSKLLREGVHFRPQLHDAVDTSATAAEQSF